MSAGDNGQSRPRHLAVLVIDADEQSQLQIRSAIRATEMFGTILSAGNALIAHDAMNGPDALVLDLVIVDSTMLNALALARGPAASGAVFAIVAEAGADVPDIGWPLLQKPVTAGDIERLFQERD